MRLFSVFWHLSINAVVWLHLIGFNIDMWLLQSKSLVKVAYVRSSFLIKINCSLTEFTLFVSRDILHLRHVYPVYNMFLKCDLINVQT